MTTFHSFLKLPMQFRCMLFAAFVFNLGFYMLIPFLAGYLTDNLLLSASLVGVVLGVRSFCQQGLFLIGGLLADLLGHKQPIVIGCLLRALGFSLFLFSDNIYLLFSAALLTGFAGALFTPAAQAYFATQQVLTRAQMFSLVGIARNAGELIGPLCGVLLLAVSFDLLCVIAALPFALFALIFLKLLKSDKNTLPQKNSDSQIPSHQSGGILTNVLSNKRFVMFSLVMSGYFMLINQISFAIPLYLTQQAYTHEHVAWVMILCAVIAIFLQFSVTKLCEKYLTPRHWISIGIAFMGVAFAALIPNFDALNPVLFWLALGVLSVVFTLGTLVSFPFILSQISELANSQSVATHYGFFYLFAGCGLIAGSSLVGIAFDFAHINTNLAWYCLIVIGLLTAFLNFVLLSAPNEAESEQAITHSIIK